jgi:hypothetical protein
VLAALAFLPDLRQEDPDVLGGQLGKSLSADASYEMKPDDALIALVGLWPTLVEYDSAQPVVQVFSDRPAR